MTPRNTIPETNLTREFLFECAAPTGAPDKVSRAVESQALALEDLLKSYQQERSEILTGDRFTERAKQEELGKLADRTRKKFKEIVSAAPVERLEEKVELERKRYLSPEYKRLHVSPPETEDDEESVDMDDFRARQRRDEQEIRASLRQREEHERLNIVRKAVEEDDVAVLRAVELDPARSYDPLLPEETLEDLARAHAERKFPDEVREMDQLESAAGALKRNANRASQELARVTNDKRFAVPPFASSTGRGQASEEAEAVVAEA